MTAGNDPIEGFIHRRRMTGGWPKIDLELQLEQPRADRANQLKITVQMRSLTGETAADLGWRERCDRIYCDLRGYLIAHNGTADGGAG